MFSVFTIFTVCSGPYCYQWNGEKYCYEVGSALNYILDLGATKISTQFIIVFPKVLLTQWWVHNYYYQTQGNKYQHI